MLDELIATHDDGCPALVHSDLMPILVANQTDLRRFAVDEAFQDGVLSALYTQLQTLVRGRDLWLPTFNYDYCQKKKFDVAKTVSQVGIFSEYFRLKHSIWRTKTPIFSISGIGLEPPACVTADGKLDPFSVFSDFGHFVERDGLILFFGARFSPTFIHYIERCFRSGPLYRYDKIFEGIVSDGLSNSEISVNYHVIPRSVSVKYDVDKIAADLRSDGLLQPLPTPFHPCEVISARSMLDYCFQRLERDPYYFLTEDTVDLVAPMIKKIGRRLKITDFDDNDSLRGSDEL